jgi:hypothetical protein
MPRAASQERARFAADEVRGHERGIPLLAEQLDSFAVAPIAREAQADPERRVDEDHGRSSGP